MRDLSDDKFKIFIAVVLGIVLFSIELLSSLFSIITFGLGGFLLVLFLIGMFSRSFGNGLVSAAVTLILMIPIGLVLLPLVDSVVLPENVVAGAIMVFLLLLCRPLNDISSEQSSGLACIAILLFPLIIIMGSFFVMFGILVSGLGGVLGASLWKRIENRNTDAPSL